MVSGNQFVLHKRVRGYTSHEHLDRFGFINMNGRMYGYHSGRMFSPDNYVQNPNFTQSYNRYSYVWNNPTKYVDPSGEVVLFMNGFCLTSEAGNAKYWGGMDNNIMNQIGDHSARY